ncbi:di-heme oxidoredictase family protein [Pollutimonas harenae]|uniref:C-type cytochrome n=1 Tax=Pollutimonas harenae TaxID=657015 RepID=A0A853H541_9BURK|nr:di-heme oxidoredictase family protein [Pollutimonas harenae]NYT85234.1 c-type cytochrome [Pollutimonas harenae]TEA72396.1 c-type cytochrome [Pollutimonas harenae]
MQQAIGLLLLGLALEASAGSVTQRADLNPQDLERVAAITQPTSDFSQPEAFEIMQGGAGTVKKRINPDIFSHPAANLTFEARQEFMVGNGLFRKDWVSSPASTQASDGLGPLFNARSCQGCHVKDGRGSVPGFESIDRSDAVSLLVRLSLPSSNDDARARLDRGEVVSLPDPIYGHQLQPFAVAGLPAEGQIKIDYTEIPVSLNGGEMAYLMSPAYSIENLGYGPLHPELRLSPRLAPPMLGLGLLEAIHQNDILANIDRGIAKGVSGRANWVRDKETGEKVLGRFNWKAGQPDVEHQASAAFSGDMGLSTPLFPSHYGDCTAAQQACFLMPNGAQENLGEHEVPARLMDFVTMYSQNLALPQRRDVDDARVLAGKKQFYESNCIACHVPKYVTRRDASRPEHRFQLIWPYTDLLLHDMGSGLADGQEEGDASGREWRTPPLWGIGLTKTVNPDATWLHDGRARTLLEAVLWHGGEAQAARDRVVAMTPQERADLIRFLESL